MRIENLTFKEENKKIIVEEKRHDYSYYEYTPEKILDIVKKNPNDVENDEWKTLIQMLYPDSLICSGLFQPLLLFHIKNGLRVDPPYLAFNNITEYNKKIKSSLFEKICDFLTDNGVELNDTWLKVLESIKKDYKE